VLRNGAITPTGADRKFVPVEGRVIGGIDTHDIGVEMSTARGDRSSSIRCIVAWRQ